jgi:gliding motility-associated-like protein
MTKHCIIYFFLCVVPFLGYSQDIALYEQFNGRYDYTAIGNTMNLFENGPFPDCDILTSSSATLNLSNEQTIIAAYLYWAGSGPGDFDVQLNDIAITAERTFADAIDETRIFFAAFADVTSIIQNFGNDTYTLSDLDVSTFIPDYCATGTNFAGWAITVIYQDPNLPLNQVNVYDGLQSVPTDLTIVLDNLNVLDNDGAKIGFVSWEGDSALAVNETLTINNTVIGNPPLNPPNNAFNGTNSFTGETNLYNMDIDVYNIQNNIAIGDTNATISLTSGQDFVMINNVITVLNSQLPDATVIIDTIFNACNNRNVTIDFTVSNNNSTDSLPENTPIAIYADNILIGETQTSVPIPINGSESMTISMNIPFDIPEDFLLSIVVDDNGLGQSTINEIDETNNADSETVTLIFSPEVITLDPLENCDIGFDTAFFDLTTVLDQIDLNYDASTMAFYHNLNDLITESNTIITPENFQNTEAPQTLFIRIEATPCYTIYQFEIFIENCPPVVPQGFSPNSDGINDWFNIQGLYDIFEQHELLIYNRYGTLIFKGNNSLYWDGTANKGLNNKGELLPVGTYFYVLKLNDKNYKTLTGWVYLNY